MCWWYWCLVYNTIQYNQNKLQNIYVGFSSKLKLHDSWGLTHKACLKRTSPQHNVFLYRDIELNILLRNHGNISSISWLINAASTNSRSTCSSNPRIYLLLLFWSRIRVNFITMVQNHLLLTTVKLLHKPTLS